MASSVQAPRRAYGTPNSSISSRIQPTPAPRITRPGARWSSVASIFAVSTGWRCGSTSTLVPRRAREVTAAASVSAVSGSRKSVEGDRGKSPVALYG
jgi:hypothetical protein